MIRRRAALVPVDYMAMLFSDEGFPPTFASARRRKVEPDL